jgi:dextranase
VELIPDRAHYDVGVTVGIELAPPPELDGEILVTRLQHEVARVPVAAGTSAVALGAFERGGYGVRFGATTTAFDVADSPFERPRYGFVARLTDDVDLDAVTRNFRRLHLNLAQLYDWAYRHSTLMPPSERYTDPLGLERTLSMVQAMSGALSSSGTVPLGYSAG